MNKDEATNEIRRLHAAAAARDALEMAKAERKFLAARDAYFRDRPRKDRRE